MPHIEKYFTSRDRAFRNQEVMKRGEMQKKNFRFLDRLPYFPFYRTIVLNEKVKVLQEIQFLFCKNKFF